MVEKLGWNYVKISTARAGAGHGDFHGTHDYNSQMVNPAQVGIVSMISW